MARRSAGGGRALGLLACLGAAVIGARAHTCADTPIPTVNGCRCKPETIDEDNGKRWCGCDTADGATPWCDVEPGCAGATEGEWDHCPLRSTLRLEPDDIDLWPGRGLVPLRVAGAAACSEGLLPEIRCRKRDDGTEVRARSVPCTNPGSRGGCTVCANDGIRFFVERTASRLELAQTACKDGGSDSCHLFQIGVEVDDTLLRRQQRHGGPCLEELAELVLSCHRETDDRWDISHPNARVDLSFAVPSYVRATSLGKVGDAAAHNELCLPDGMAPDGYTIDPALPAGLLFDKALGTISGTPLSAGVSRHRVRVNLPKDDIDFWERFSASRGREAFPELGVSVHVVDADPEDVPPPPPSRPGYQAPAPATASQAAGEDSNAPMVVLALLLALLTFMFQDMPQNMGEMLTQWFTHARPSKLEQAAMDGFAPDTGKTPEHGQSTPRDTERVTVKADFSPTSKFKPCRR